MTKASAMCMIYVAVVSLTTGCKSMFPTEDKLSQSTWQSFAEAQIAFDKITPHQTDIEDLKKLGFDPFITPNIKLLTYRDIIERFIPNHSITMQDLQEDVRLCIQSKDCCQAYELDLDTTKSKRYGNLCLDVLGFKKKTRITGWNFKALVIIKDGVVTYKLRSGEPNVDRLEKKVKPLGPFQELDGLAGRLPGVM